jgi:hypothetical protein
MLILPSTQWEDIISIMRHEEKGCFSPSEHYVVQLSQQYGLNYVMRKETYSNVSYHICDWLYNIESIDDGLVPLLWGCTEDLTAEIMVKSLLYTEQELLWIDWLVMKYVRCYKPWLMMYIIAEDLSAKYFGKALSYMTYEVWGVIVYMYIFCWYSNQVVWKEWLYSIYVLVKLWWPIEKQCMRMYE